MVVNSLYPSPLDVPDAACIMALAAASCVALRLLNAKPFRQLTPQGRFDQRFALVRFNVNTTVDCCVLESVAKNAFDRHTTFATPVSEEQLVEVVVVVLTVNERLQVCPPKLIANDAVPEEVGVPEIA